MPNITDRPSVTAAGTVDVQKNAQSALELGAKVLAQLATQPSATTMQVPASMLQDLAAAVVQLAAAMQASSSAPAAAPPSTSPTVDASWRMTSAYQQPGLARDDLTAVASKLREKCADLGIRMNIDVNGSFGVWELKVTGQAPKDKLDALKTEAGKLLNPSFTMNPGKLEVLKYDVV